MKNEFSTIADTSSSFTFTFTFRPGVTRADHYCSMHFFTVSAVSASSHLTKSTWCLVMIVRKIHRKPRYLFPLATARLKCMHTSHKLVLVEASTLLYKVPDKRVWMCNDLYRVLMYDYSLHTSHVRSSAYI